MDSKGVIQEWGWSVEAKIPFKSLRYAAGTILLRLGQAAEALTWLFSAYQLDHDHEPTKKALAEGLQKLGDPKLVEYYRQALGGG